MSVILSSYRGDTIKVAGNVVRNIEGVLTNVDMSTASSVKYTLKSSYTGVALFQKTVGAGITISGTDNSEFEVKLSPADTSVLAAPADYYWDVQLTEADTTVTTVAAGTLRLLVDVTTT